MSEQVLLDSEGALSIEFEAVLKTVFLRYASDHVELPSKIIEQDAEIEEEDVVISSTKVKTGEEDSIYQNAQTLARDDLDRFARATNGQAMTDETYEECSDYFDMIDERLTFKGFMQLYQLQTENDESETINDLKSWGFTKDLAEAPKP